MEAILSALGNPERGLKSIHIAGTNGKGSTAAMVTAFAKAHGLRVGTSLHRIWTVSGNAFR